MCYPLSSSAEKWIIQAEPLPQGGAVQSQNELCGAIVLRIVANVSVSIVDSGI